VDINTIWDLVYVNFTSFILTLYTILTYPLHSAFISLWSDIPYVPGIIIVTNPEKYTNYQTCQFYYIHKRKLYTSVFILVL